jgi:hypothetical protein
MLLLDYVRNRLKSYQSVQKCKLCCKLAAYADRVVSPDEMGSIMRDCRDAIYVAADRGETSCKIDIPFVFGSKNDSEFRSRVLLIYTDFNPEFHERTVGKCPPYTNSYLNYAQLVLYWS